MDAATDQTTPGEARRGLLGVYRPADPLFVRGEGCELVDETGRRYLDFTSGIAVTSLGHGHPALRAAIERSLADGLVHTSNLFRTRPAEELAVRLTELSGLDRAFFCNSGGEGVEAALKFARRWARETGGPEKHRFVALRGSFHGRLLGSLAATDRPAYREPFEPVMPGVDFVDPEDHTALERALDPERTAALLVEPIQGEGGVRELPAGTLDRLRERTRERGVALVLDEVQCGLGRTGELFAHRSTGIRPDVLVLAKPLAGGLPMGATLVTEEIAGTIRPGDHGTTFGGGPLVASAALAVLDELTRPGFLEGVRERADTLDRLLEDLARRRGDEILELRGRGMIRGVRIAGEASGVVDRAREKGLLLVPAGRDVVRLLPPLVAEPATLERAVSILEEALT